MCQLITCAKCCSIFSISGIIFLLVIGALFQKQPDLFKGLTIDASAAAAGSYQAAGLYAATFAISIAYWLLDDMRNGKGFFAGRSSNRMNSNEGAERMKFGSKYGAVATH